MRYIAALDALTQLPIPDALWDSVGEHLAALRSAGFRFPLADVVISAMAIHYYIELWSRDQHYQTIQAVLPQLRLWEGAP